MPKIAVNLEDINQLTGKDLTIREFEKISPNIKCEWIGAHDGEIELEVTHDRPDLLSSEGIARALRQYFGLQKGLQKLEFKKSGLHCTVDKSVLQVRPHSRMFVVYGVKLTDATVQQLMQLQEKIHASYTLNRKNASIGVYDLDTLKFPLTYKSVKDIRFIPLGESREMTAKEILEKTEKGRAYAKLIEPAKYPIIVDSKGTVLSMPPIINSEDTRVTPSTSNLFVDVSGEDQLAVEKTVTLMAVALSERGEVRTVSMDYPDRSIESPMLKKQEISTSAGFVNARLGLRLSENDIKELLEKAGFGVSLDRGRITAEVPCYRFDIMHEIDLTEEVAMAYGYDKLEPVFPEIFTIGKADEIETLSNKTREIMIGMGFQEVLTYILEGSNLFDAFNIKAVKLDNPVSDEHDCIRSSLVPGLIELLSNNKHYPLPHKIFEVGDIVTQGDSPLMERRVAAVISDTEAGFTLIKSVAEAVMKNLNSGYSITEYAGSPFITGRAAAIESNKKRIGVFGEVHPSVLNHLDIEHPVVTMELNLEAIKK